MIGNKSLIKQIIKFILVGLLATGIDIGLLLFLTEYCNILYIVSNGISFFISVIFNFVFSIYFVYNLRRKDNIYHQFAIFTVLSVGGLFINQCIMYICVEFLLLDYKVAKLYVTAIVMIYNFISRKLYFEGKGGKNATHRLTQ